MNTETTWKVYFPEFVTVYTSTGLGETGGQECRNFFAGEYAGRVHDEDWRVVQQGTVSLINPRSRLEVRLPNLRGEFKDRTQAMDMLTVLGPEASLVTTGSPEERRLLSYGKTRLPR